MGAPLAPAAGLVGLDHVQVGAPAGGEEQARAFYGGLLGLAEQPKPPLLAARGGVWFALGSQGLHVGIDPAHAPPAKAHPALRAADGAALDALAARLQAADCPVQWDDAIPGTRRFYTLDPFGNRLEVVA